MTTIGIRDGRTDYGYKLYQIISHACDGEKTIQISDEFKITKFLVGTATYTFVDYVGKESGDGKDRYRATESHFKEITTVDDAGIAKKPNTKYGLMSDFLKF